MGRNNSLFRRCSFFATPRVLELGSPKYVKLVDSTRPLPSCLVKSNSKISRPSHAGCFQYSACELAVKAQRVSAPIICE